MKKEEIKLVLRYQKKYYFLARIIKYGDAYIATTTPDDEQAKRDYGKSATLPWLDSSRAIDIHKVDKSYYLSNGVLEIETAQCGKLKRLQRYNKFKHPEDLVVIDNSLLRAHSNESITFNLLIVDFSKHKTIDVSKWKSYPLLHCINMQGYFLIIAFLRPGSEERLLKQLA